MVIKSIVIGGGGPLLVGCLSSARYLLNEKFWNYDDLQSLYGSSMGSLIIIFLLLKIDLLEIENYLIKRPWNKVFLINPEDVLNFLQEKGLLDLKFIINTVLEPLFKIVNLDLNITIKDFYNYCGKEFNFITSNLSLSPPNIEIISYKNYPDLSLVDGLSMSMCHPIIFKPINLNNKVYIDGGLFSNFPLKYCLENEDIKEDEILGLWKIHDNNFFNNNENGLQFKDSLFNSNSSFFEFINHIYDIMRFKSLEDFNYNLENKVLIGDKEMVSYNYWNKIFNFEEDRKKIFLNGTEMAKEFLIKKS